MNEEEKRIIEKRLLVFSNMYKIEEKFKIIFLCKYRHNTRGRKLTSAMFAQKVQGLVLLEE